MVYYFQYREGWGLFLKKLAEISNLMKIVVKTTNIKLTKELQEFIEEKINSLEKFSKILQNKKNTWNLLLKRENRQWRPG